MSSHILPAGMAKLKAIAGAAGAALIFALMASTASASPVACVSGNLSTIDYTTCDIGNLQFTFEGLASDNSVNYAPGSPWTNSDFTFTVLSNGFALSGPPAQTITAPAGGEADDLAQLDFYVADLAGSIVGLTVSGGNLSSSGPGPISTASNALSLISNTNSQVLFSYNEVYDEYGTVYYNELGYTSGSGPIYSGNGYATPFSLEAVDSNTAGISSTTTDFIFTTEAGPLNPPAPAPPPPTIPQVPEPRLLGLLSIGVLGLAGVARYKLRKARTIAGTL